MRLIGRDKLARIRGKSEQFESWMRNWVAEVLNAHWKHPSDVQEQFPNAQHHGEGRFLFPVNNCNCAICILIAFPQGIALITDLKVDNGTH